jgi:VWFA-related protein
MRRASLSLTLLLVSGCGSAVVESEIRPTDCLKLTLQNGGFSTAPPARVSLFFTVDTCRGDPVAGLTEDRFHLYEDGLAVSQFESQQRIQPRGERVRISSVLLLDLSGSLLRSGSFPQLREAAAAFIDQVFSHDPDAHRVALYTFDGRKDLTPLVPLTSDQAALKAGLSSLERVECSVNADCALFIDRRTCAGWRCVDDSTNLYGAVVQGLSAVQAAVASSPEIAHRQGALVVFTDGTDQAARVTQKAAVDAVAASASNVFTVGLGGEVDAAALRALGKDGFYSAGGAEELATAFGAVAERLTAMAQRYYLLEYCSPKRSGLHKLRVEATAPQVDSGGILTGTLTAEFNATGFESGCFIPAPIP